MRIRKRQASFSLSSLSDPQLHSSSLVQQLHSTHSNPPQILSSHDGKRQADSWKGSSSVGEDKKDGLVVMMQEMQAREGVSRGVDDEVKAGHYAREGSISGVEALIMTHQESSASSCLAPSWFRKGDKAITFKGRGGSFEGNARKECTIIDEKDKNMKPKKCPEVKPNVQETKQNRGVGGAKKRARGGAIMEGSRCSRVNGRGWRCCQPTMVGYSLCEHHLGKGRLRSMNTIRSRSLGGSISAEPKNSKSEAEQLSSSLKEKQPKYKNRANEHGEEKPMGGTKKRMKLGIVKARTISSLLGQTNNAVGEADNETK